MAVTSAPSKSVDSTAMRVYTRTRSAHATCYHRPPCPRFPLATAGPSNSVVCSILRCKVSPARGRN